MHPLQSTTMNGDEESTEAVTDVSRPSPIQWHRLEMTYNAIGMDSMLVSQVT